MAALFISDGPKEARNACSAKPPFKAQSLQYPMDNFIIFDRSGGKGGLFFHHALTCKLFGTAHLSQPQKTTSQDAGLMQRCKGSGANNIEYVGTNLDGYKDAIAGNSISLQGLLSVRDNNWPVLKPYSASLASAQIGNSQSGDPKMESCSSEVMQENSEDLDALLSSGDDSGEAGTYNTAQVEDDDEVKSTGHSPDEPSTVNDGKDEEAESRPPAKLSHTRPRAKEAESRAPAKRRKLGNMTGDSFHVTQWEELKGICQISPAMRRCKIKKTLKALRKMIPGGAFVDAAMVIDETIRYVKILQEHGSQLGAGHFQSNC